MDTDFNRQMHLIDERYQMENALLDALRDAGLCGREVERFLALEAAGEREGQLRLLFAHRQQLLKRLHREEKRIDCLDYLVHQLRKQAM